MVVVYFEAVDGDLGSLMGQVLNGLLVALDQPPLNLHGS